MYGKSSKKKVFSMECPFTIIIKIKFDKQLKFNNDKKLKLT